MRPAGPQDRAPVEAFLRGHVETSMFPLSNLLHHGMSGGHPRSVSFWLAEAGGQITDVLTLTDEGMVMPQCPSGDWRAAARVLAGRRVIGILGEATGARAFQRAAGLSGLPCQVDQDQTLFSLALADLHMPEVTGQIVPMAEAPRDLIVSWMIDYLKETFGPPAEDTPALAEARVAEFSLRASHVVLMIGEEPVAMTGLNAELPEIVQIGGVYTPPAQRGRGYARQALALHLARLRDAGCRRAILFADNPAAKASYRGIGFSEIGKFTLCVFDGPQEVAG